jgi:hypothetical protein
MSVRDAMMDTVTGLKKVESATKRPKKRRPESVELARRTIEVVDVPRGKNEVSPLQLLTIQHLARGYLLPEVARKFADQLCPHEANREKRMKKARTKIRKWMASAKMRDLLWEETMIGLDMDSPLIVRGISRKARAGRVDAARLALELNGRHAPHTEVTPAQINIQFGDIPRPRRSSDDATEGDPDEVIDDADWEET